MKKWLKFEDKLNQKIIALLEYLLFLYKKYCPIKIQLFLSNTHQAIRSARLRSIQSIKTKSLNAIHTIPTLGKKIGDSLGNIQGYLTHIILSLKKANKKKGQFKFFYHSVLAAIVSFLCFIRDWYLSLKRSTVIVSISTTSIISYSLFNIYFQSNSIIKSLTRAPASIDTSTFIDVRPKYYKRDERYFTLFHVKMPLFVESVSGHKNIQLDLTILPSNKYIKEFFFRNEYIVKDKLNVMVHAVIPSLPATEEGKVIIKEKVKIELNNLLKEQNIKGEIEEVYVNSILGT